MNRTQLLAGMNPPTQWINMLQRFARLGLGQLVLDMLGQTQTGLFTNMTISPAGGLTVSVAPTVANTQAALYQFLQEEVTAYGGYPSGTGPLALPVDTTEVFLQGLMSAACPAMTCAAPGTAGQSIDYLIEAQIQTSDTTNQNINIVSSTGIVTPTTGNRDRVDNIIFQAKAGAAATTGTQVPPAVDAGWVAIGYVSVANGVTVILSGMITLYSQWAGFAKQTSSGQAGLTLNARAQANNVNIGSTGSAHNLIAAQSLVLGVSAGTGWRVIIEGDVSPGNAADAVPDSVALISTTTGSGAIWSTRAPNALPSGDAEFTNAIATAQIPSSSLNTTAVFGNTRVRYEAYYANNATVTVALAVLSQYNTNYSGCLSISAYQY